MLLFSVGSSHEAAAVLGLGSSSTVRNGLLADVAAVAERLATQRFQGAVLATAQSPDEVAELEACGVTDAYDPRAAAGVGFVSLSERYLSPRRETT